MDRRVGAAAVMAFAIGTAARAQPPPGGSSANTSAATQPPAVALPAVSSAEPGVLGSSRLSGRILSLAPHGDSVTIASGGKPMRFELHQSSTIFVDGRLGGLQDLKEGVEVRAAYESRDGQVTIRWIEVAPPPAKTTPEPAANSLNAAAPHPTR